MALAFVFFFPFFVVLFFFAADFFFLVFNDELGGCSPPLDTTNSLNINIINTKKLLRLYGV
jgi:hypothetical protein